MRRKKRKWPKILAMALAAVILTGSVALVLVEKFAPDQTYIPTNIVSLPSRVVSIALKPFQNAFAWAANGVAGYLQSWKMFKAIEGEYNKLKAQNDELIYQALLNETLEAEIAQLRKQVELYNTFKLETPITAMVTAKETGNWFAMFTINVGEKQGVEKDMAVINADGLIGYIYQVYDTTSVVVSIIDSRAGVAGQIQSSRDQGVIRGTLGIEEEATCRMYYLPVDSIPRPGDVVVTSGIGAPFPKGLRIGTIRESTRETYENKRYVVVEPFVDFEHIEYVLVLVYKPDPEAVPVTVDDGQFSYVPGPMDTPRPSPSVGEQIADPNLGGVTAPPRMTREPGEGADGQEPVATGDPAFTLAPGATPTPNPELDRLLMEELAAEEGE